MLSFLTERVDASFPLLFELINSLLSEFRMFVAEDLAVPLTEPQILFFSLVFIGQNEPSFYGAPHVEAGPARWEVTVYATAFGYLTN